MMREWEVWHETRARHLSGAWGNPNECAKGKIPRAGRSHWGLIEKASSLVEGKSVLDIGCGFGHLFSLLRDKEYLGVDTSEQMLKRARDFFPEDKDKFQIGDAYDLSSLPEFNTVVAIGLIIHIPDPEKVLNQLWSKTKICTVFSAWIGDSPLIKKIPDGKRTIFERRYTIKDFDLMFSNLAGLGKVEKNPHSHPQANYFFRLWRNRYED